MKRRYRQKKTAPGQQRKEDLKALQLVAQSLDDRLREYMRPYFEAVVRAGGPLRERKTNGSDV
jgi:hypothetical protein